MSATDQTVDPEPIQTGILGTSSSKSPLTPKRAPQVASRVACPSLTRRGAVCHGTPTASGWCWFHDPAVSKEAKQAAALKGAYLSVRKSVLKSAGGTLPIEPPTLTTSDQCLAFVQTTIHRVQTNQLSPSVANSIATLVGLALRLAELRLDAEALDQLADAEAQATRGPRVIVDTVPA